MIRSQELIDKLVADLHFHNYLFVNECDNIFTDRNETISNVENIIKSLGLNDNLNAHTDFFHGGHVVVPSTIDHIYDYIDDVYVDYFFRTHNFRPIIIPAGICEEQVTPQGLSCPNKNQEVILNLNDIYDRCTFISFIFKSFGQNETKLCDLFPNNHFLGGFQLNSKKGCFIIENEYPYSNELQTYINIKYQLNSKFKPTLRADEIAAFGLFCDKNRFNFDYDGFSFNWLSNYSKKTTDYYKIKDCHIFGEYSIEDVLMLYALLADKFVLSEEKLTTYLAINLEMLKENSILNDFKTFENKHTDYKEIEPFIHSKDLYLRFTSRKNSRAFKFTPHDRIYENIQLFDQKPIRSLVYNNPQQLPYLYNSLNLY